MKYLRWAIILVILISNSILAQDLPDEPQYEQDDTFYAECLTLTGNDYYLFVVTKFSLKTFEGSITLKWASFDPYRNPNHSSFNNILSKEDIELKKVDGRNVFVIKSSDEFTGDKLKILIPTQIGGDPRSVDLSEILFNDFSGEIACSNEVDIYKKTIGM